VKIKLDENLPHSAVHLLRRAGHDVDTVVDEGLAGADDLDVVAAASEDARLLLTLDRGLGDVRSYPPGTHAGIFVLRLDHQSPRVIRGAVDRIASEVELDELQNCITVWRNGEVRVRRA